MPTLDEQNNKKKMLMSGDAAVATNTNTRNASANASGERLQRDRDNQRHNIRAMQEKHMQGVGAAINFDSMAFMRLYETDPH